MATRAARLSVELLADAGGSAVWGIVRHSAQTGVTELPGSGQDATGSGSGQKILPKPDSLEVWVGSGRVGSESEISSPNPHLSWSKRRLTNSGQAVPAGRAGGPAQPVILLTGRTGLFDQCASQAGLHNRNVQPARWSNTPVWPVSQVTGREGPPAQPVGTARPVLVKHRLDCYVQAVIAGSVQLILRAT
ncbi:hypothetical protein PCASD_22700 [Puccinia coronata f. sp. avenae]|uniref:Uncharacterized protein n=1 Tax=Puccinia coronata f. sp. avenae TaxID=200324 RepID=A0A2N5TTD2_9BASI|nr:hypothetical protein PCASD_22700 [Puccinia coronata f. sp. avenae]